MKKFLIALLFAPVAGLGQQAAASTSTRRRTSVSDKAALQNGAKLFVNYCLNCHGASPTCATTA